MRHNKHSTETTESRFLGTISAFSIRNHHDAMEERTAEENKVVEKAERMGSVAMESSAHLTDLTCLALISPTQRRSRLPSADLAYPPCRSRLPNTDLSSPFHFFSFFLHSSPISPEFFLSFADLTWVFLLWLWVDFLGLGCCCGFYFCGCGLALRSEFLALIIIFFFLIIRGLRLCLVAEKMKENHSFYSFRDKPMNPIWVLS